MKGQLARCVGLGGMLLVTCTWAATSLGATDPLFAPPPAAPVQGEVTTTGYSGPNRALLGSGFAVLGLSYVPAVVVAAQSTQKADEKLYIPVAGPWIDLANRPSCLGNGASAPACAPEPGNRALIAVDGVFQGMGALLVAGAVLMPERRHVVTTARTADEPEIHFTPAQLGPGGYGMAAFGSF